MQRRGLGIKLEQGLIQLPPALLGNGRDDQQGVPQKRLGAWAGVGIREVEWCQLQPLLEVSATVTAVGSNHVCRRTRRG